ncbi:DUF4334 domain-containing protein [Maricaulis parjimensis]|uniref:DUF4334 domain-containing protein n=1 Tax=Maricaulis parjimensis TaxID=144023 RepID=UPI0019397838|nr:DUF4334 domain-containing protein [Maricaulis parjimensis]
MMTFDDALSCEAVSGADALSLFDNLPPADEAFMIGSWKGEGFATGHPMDGLLESAGWYGKQFVDRNSVHPLLYTTEDGREVFAVDPARLDFNRSGNSSAHLGAWRDKLETEAFTARLRMTEYRGALCATMIYDARPINDVFKRVNDDTALGIMDMRGLDKPFFFVLRRSAALSVPGAV